MGTQRTGKPRLSHTPDLRRVAVLVFAGMLVAANMFAATAIEDERINQALGAILLTNIGLIVSIVFAAGVSMQRLRSLEKWQNAMEIWKATHEQWSQAEVEKIAGARETQWSGIERRLSEYVRTDVLGPQLESINDKLDDIRNRGCRARGDMC